MMNNWKDAVNELVAIAVGLEEQPNTRERAGKIFASASDICVRYDDLERAAMTAEDALTTLQNICRESGVAMRTLAIICFRQWDVGKGECHLNNAMVIFKQFGELMELQVTTRVITDYLHGQGKHQEAFMHIESLYKFMENQLKERGIVL